MPINTSTSNKSTNSVSKDNITLINLDISGPSNYNTITKIQNTLKINSNSSKATSSSEKKQPVGFLKNLFGKSKLRSNSISLPASGRSDLTKMDSNCLKIPTSPVQSSVGPDDFIKLYRQRTLSDCASIERARDSSRRQKSFSHNEDSGDFLLDDSCDDMSKFHFLIWKDKIRGTKYFKLLKSSGIESDLAAKPHHVFRKFLSDHAAYDLMPHSVKLITFNTKLTVKKAFFALVENFMKAAILWDSSKQAITGMLTITDFMEILFKFYKNQESFEEIENQSINSWKEQLHERALISLGPEDSLLHGCEMLLREKVHRCLVLDGCAGNPLYVLTQKRLLRFLCANFEFMVLPAFMNKSIKELQVGSYQNIATITNSSTLLEVLHLFVEKRVSALPVVDANNTLLNVFSKVDFANLVPEKLYHDINMSAEKALQCRKGVFETAHTCSFNDSLLVTIERIVNAQVHRLIIVDELKRVVGILSLSDILQCMVVRCGESK